jgi:hypothetical protein
MRNHDFFRWIFRGNSSQPCAAVLEDAGRYITKLPKAEHEAGCGMLRESNDAKEKHRRLEFLKHVDGEIVGSNLAIPVGPNAIHLIALDTPDGHQWPA